MLMPLSPPTVLLSAKPGGDGPGVRRVNGRSEPGSSIGKRRGFASTFSARDAPPASSRIAVRNPLGEAALRSNAVGASRRKRGGGSIAQRCGGGETARARIIPGGEAATLRCGQNFKPRDSYSQESTAAGTARASPRLTAAALNPIPIDTPSHSLAESWVPSIMMSEALRICSAMPSTSVPWQSAG